MDQQATSPAEEPERAPETPLLVFDGDCTFCRHWVRRWGGITGARVAYRPYQEVASQFPEIGPEGFRRKVWLIEPGGRVSSGARAVFRLYELAGEKRWLGRAYESLPGFASVAEGAYALVARHRGGAAVATRWLWGDAAERPSYRRARSAFLRALGVVYLAAFGSLAVQVDGLIGRRGILPAAEFLDRLGPILGPSRYWQLPTLFWWDASDRALHVVCWGGMALGGLLALGVLPRACLALLWLGYLSLTVVGQEFLGFQWDALLLEAGLLAIPLAPAGAWLGRDRLEPSRVWLGLVRWLVFRLMFLSAMVKLASGDPAWRAWRALRHHYETQPLPTWTSWYAHQAPAWFQWASVGLMFWAELIAPFLVFGPRRVRMLGFWSFVLLQGAIAATGNYGFFNLLTVALCLVLVEDRDWPSFVGAGWKPAPPAIREAAPRGPWRQALVGALAAAIVLVTTMEGVEAVWRRPVFPGPLQGLRDWVRPFRSLNSYGLFAVMTTERPEILVEGSRDGVTWRPYPFRWKPGELDRRPRFTTPHMPRLDWQMWFAALAGDCRAQPWFLAFEERLLEGSPEVLALLREDPFPGPPPRYVRARLFLYRFTTWGARDWWSRAELGSYCPPWGL